MAAGIQPSADQHLIDQPPKKVELKYLEKIDEEEDGDFEK